MITQNLNVWAKGPEMAPPFEKNKKTTNMSKKKDKVRVKKEIDK